MRRLIILAKSDVRKQEVLGGVTTHVRFLLEAVDSKSWDVDILTFTHWMDIFRLRRASLRHQDVVYLNISITDRGLLKLFLQLLVIKNSRVVVQFHGGSFVRLRYFRWYGPVLLNRLRRVSRLLFLTDEELIRFQKLSEPIDFPVQRAFNYVKIAELNHHHRKEKCLRFLFVGRLSREKGIFELLKAWMSLDRNELDRDVELHIVGDGPAYEEVCSSCEDDPSIKVHGVCVGEEKWAHFRESHVFVLPSYSEGLPYAVLEAMSYGLPVITTKVGALVDVVEHGVSGLFVSTGDVESLRSAIIYLAKVPSRISRMGQASRRIIEERFSFEKGSLAINKLLSDVMVSDGE